MTENVSEILRHLLNSLGEGVIFFDPENRVRWTNETFERMRGNSRRDSLFGRSIFDCHPSKDRGKVSQILNDLRIGRETIRHHRAKRSGIIDAEKETQYDIFYTAVRNGQGDYLGTAMIIRNVSEIRNLQDQVQRSEEKYKDLVENLDSGIFSLNEKGRITYANNGLLSMLGYHLNEIINRAWTELVKPESRAETEQIFNAVLLGQKGRILETQLLRRDGKPIHALLNLSALDMEPENPSMVRGILTDITAQKELERETLERERFQGVIEMAGATCHHLNQPLTNILVRAQMLLREMNKQDPHHHAAEIIEKEAIRMGDITRKIQNITSYETEPYVEGHSRIIDLEQASRKK